MKILEHHGSVIDSLLRLEGWRKGVRRTNYKIALDWYRGQSATGGFYGRIFGNERRDSSLIKTVENALKAEQEGGLEKVSDFSQKRDVICEACPAKATDCWRKDDSLSLQEAIQRLRQRT